ncbi:MAG: uracil phosphoribosyltransferase [Erysipelotrichales bacterium]|nr:uracil phosphoribosyltransferase [Erysipelotrichales bacterium]
MSIVKICDHPLINHKLAHARNHKTGTKDFREAVNEIAGLMTFEITRNLKTQTVEIETPICNTKCMVMDMPIVVVPILRAGLGMVEGIQNLIPTIKIGHLGIFRCETTLNPKTYFQKFPDNLNKSLVLVVDPMLATGGSAVEAIRILKAEGAKDIRFVGLVGCPEGISRMQMSHPDVDIYLAAVDSHLNEKGYIVPGLGDCGDRLFGTK